MKTDFPKITVVTVTYNAEQYLEQTIKSVIEQDYPNIEYIIIDGASSDGTVDIIKKYEKYLSYWISEPDKGIYDAMNKGIDVATGEWINFMNAGDSFVDPNTILKVFSTNFKDADIIGGNYFYVKDKNKEYKISPKLTKVFNSTFCCHQSLFTKTLLMKKFKFDTSLKIVADYDFMLKVYIQNYKFYFVDFAIANYLAGGFFESNYFNANIEQLYVVSKYTKNFNNIYNSYMMKYVEKNKPKELINTNLTFSKLFNTFEDTLEKLNLENKRFILYGFGKIGKLIYTKYKNSIIKVVDKDFEKLLQKENIEIFSPDILKEYKNDFILISVLGREEAIKKILKEDLKIKENKILEFKIEKISI